MARKQRQLSNAFNQLSNNEQENEQMNDNTQTEQENVTVEEQQDATQTAQEATEEVVEQQESHTSPTVKDVANRLQEKYQEKANKPTVEDTHIRTTFLFRKDLAKRLDKLSRNKRGFKTAFINEAIEALLNEIE